MNLMVKYMLLVLQVYAIVSSAVLQRSSASTHFEPASGPKGNIILNEPPPDATAPIISIPEVSSPSPLVIPPTIPVSVPPIPQPDTGPTIKSPVNPPIISAPPPKDVIQNPPPMAQAAPPFMSQAPPSIPQAPPPKEVIQNPPLVAQVPPPFIFPDPVASPPTKLPMASPPINLPLPAESPPITLPSSPPMVPIIPVPPSNLPAPVASPPSTLPINSPPSPPTSTVPLPSFPAPAASTDSPPSPPTLSVPPPNLPAPVASAPSTLPRDSPPSPPRSIEPPPNLRAPVASPPTTLPRDSPSSPPTLTVPSPNLPVPVASPPRSSSRNAPPPQPPFAEPPTSLPVPVVLPPNNSPKNLQPIHQDLSMPPPNLPEPNVSPVSFPVLPSPPNRTTNYIAPSQRAPIKVPIVQNAHPPYSSHESPPTKSCPPPSLPLVYPPPPPGPKTPVVQNAPPPYSSHESPPTRSRPPPSLPPVYPPPPPGPKNRPVHHNQPPPSGPKSPPMHHPSPPPPSPGSKVPPFENSVSPSIAPPTTSPPVETTMPILSPKVSPSRSSSRIPKPLQAFPPPPPNEDCLSIICVEPLTNTPPGTPCMCVMPMQVELGLGVSLYTFFPLVTELAVEMATGLFMRSSQVRIMGANEDNQDPEKTIAIINLVALGERFDNVSAYVTAQRLWLKEVLIKSSLFGDYEVLYVRYPGLPPSPPMPSSRNGGNGESYGHGNNGRDVKPLGVDVSKQRRNNKLSGGVISIIALSGVVVVVLVCVAVWVLLLKHRDNRVQSGPTPTTTLASVTKSSGVGGSMIGSGPESASLSFRSSIHFNGSTNSFSLSDMEKATDNFNESGVLGEGGFGRVYSGVLEDGTKVAVKVLKREDQQGGREFLAEVEMLSRLHHRNLVRLLGICTEERNRCLVYDLIPNGSVESHLHGIDKETAPLDWGARLKIALDAARGLAYLHEDSSPRVIHRDFKSSNILLEHDFTPKVSDFGLARSALDEENQHISTRVMGTFGYVAPEYAMTGHLLVKSDVYSYGVVLLELLSGRKPVDMSMPPGQENLVAWARPLLPTSEGLNLLIDPTLLPEVPFDSIAKVAAIASMCVQPEVSHRPFMGEVVQALKLVCNECEETQDLGSRSCSHEDLTGLETVLGPSRSNYPTYESPLDVESGFSGLGLDVDSYRMSSSSGPLRPRRRLQIWEKMKRFSSGSMSDYGNFLRLLSRSR